MSDDAVGSAAARLGDLRAITDAALGRLDVDDLLAELLDRIRQIIDADTAAVLLLDVPSHELVREPPRESKKRWSGGSGCR